MTAEEAAGCDLGVLKTFYPHTMCGVDKLNRPILWEMDGKINAQAIVTMTTREGLLGYHFWTMQTKLDQQFAEAGEKAKVDGGEAKGNGKDKEENGGGETSQEGILASSGEDGEASLTTVFSKLGLGPDKPKGKAYSSAPINTIAVMDMTDFGMEQCTKMCLDQVKLFISTDNVCYPETLGKMLVINAPWLCTTTWNIVKGWLDARTVNKIEILSPQESMARLRDFIDEDQIPVQYGGTGPELYFPCEDCDFAWVGRGSEITKTFLVPAGKAVVLDSYVADGPLEVTISSAPSTDSTTDMAPKREERRSSFSFRSSTAAAPDLSKDSTVHVDKCIITPNEGAPERFKHVMTFPDGQAHVVTATYKNSSRVSQRPLVYAFMAMNPEEVTASSAAPPSLTHTQSEGKREAAAA